MPSMNINRNMKINMNNNNTAVRRPNQSLSLINHTTATRNSQIYALRMPSALLLSACSTLTELFSPGRGKARNPRNYQITQIPLLHHPSSVINTIMSLTITTLLYLLSHTFSLSQLDPTLLLSGPLGEITRYICLSLSSTSLIYLTNVFL